MTHVATCPECQKSFKVPHLDKTWSCKHCQVALVPKVSKAKPDFASCEECGAVLPDGVAECPECGGATKVDEPKKRRSSRSGEKSNRTSRASSRSGDRHARSEARKELAKLDWLNVALLILAGLAVLELVVLCVYLAAFLRDPGFAPHRLYLLIGITVVQLVLYLVARKAMLSPHGRPFVWVVSVAGIAVALAIWDVTSGPLSGFPSYVDYFFRDVSDGAWPWGIVRSVIALGLMFCISGASRIDKIRNDHPEAFENELAHGSATESLRKRDRLRAQGSHRLVFIVAVLIAGLAIGGIAYWMSGQPSNPNKTVTAFQEHWNAGNVSAMAEMSAADDNERWERRLNRRIKKYGWEDGMPQLDDHLWDKDRPDKFSVAFAGDEGGLEATFHWRNKRWELTGLDFSNMVP